MNGYGRGILGLPPVVKNIIMINVLMSFSILCSRSVFGVDLKQYTWTIFPKIRTVQTRPDCNPYVYARGAYAYIL